MRIVALALALMMAAAGCGSSDDDRRAEIAELRRQQLHLEEMLGITRNTARMQGQLYEEARRDLAAEYGEWTKATQGERERLEADAAKTRELAQELVRMESQLREVEARLADIGEKP